MPHGIAGDVVGDVAVVAAGAVIDGGDVVTHCCGVRGLMMMMMMIEASGCVCTGEGAYCSLYLLEVKSAIMHRGAILDG